MWEGSSCGKGSTEGFTLLQASGNLQQAREEAYLLRSRLRMLWAGLTGRET